MIPRDASPAVVLNMYGTGLGIARSLAPYGIPVIGVSSRIDASGASSRYCQHFVAPDSRDDPEGLVRFLIKLAGTIPGRAVLFPSRDHDLFFLDAHRAELDSTFAFAQPSGDALRQIMDKERLAAHAGSIGVPTPRTWKIRNEADWETIRSEVRFPAVLKPALAVQWRQPGTWEAAGARKGLRVRDELELRDAYRRIASYEPEALIQEWIGGDEDQFFVYGAYFSRDGQRVAGFTARKLLQFPPEFGLGCLVRSVIDPEVEDLATRLLRSLDFHGIAEVEFKRDPATGKCFLIEINPRHWDQHELGTRTGVNLTYIAYRDLCGLPPLPSKARTRICYWIGEQGLWGAVKEDLRHGRTRSIRLAFPSLFAPKVFALWSWRDPQPAWHGALHPKRGS